MEGIRLIPMTPSVNFPFSTAALKIIHYLSLPCIEPEVSPVIFQFTNQLRPAAFDWVPELVERHRLELSV
jgi:hypothetical protein